MHWILLVITVTGNALTSTTIEFNSQKMCEAARIKIETAQTGVRYSTYGTCVESDRGVINVG